MDPSTDASVHLSVSQSGSCGLLHRLGLYLKRVKKFSHATIAHCVLWMSYGTVAMYAWSETCCLLVFLPATYFRQPIRDRQGERQAARLRMIHLYTHKKKRVWGECINISCTPTMEHVPEIVIIQQLTTTYFKTKVMESEEAGLLPLHLIIASLLSIDVKCLYYFTFFTFLLYILTVFTFPCCYLCQVSNAKHFHLKETNPRSSNSIIWSTWKKQSKKNLNNRNLRVYLGKIKGAVFHCNTKISQPLVHQLPMNP